MKKTIHLLAAVVFTSAICLFTSYMALAQPPNLPGAGNCLSFNGTSDYVDVGNPANLDFSNTSTFTIEAWVMRNSGGPIIDKMDGSNTDSQGWFLSFYGQLYFILRNSDMTNDLEDVTTVNTFPSNVWLHVAVTYDGSNTAAGMKIYVNGMQEATTENAANLSSNIQNSAPVEIGRYYSSIYAPYIVPFSGSIDEVRIWNTARTQTQIRDNMCQKLTGSEPGLVGYWRFDETSGTTANDSSPNGNNGTLK